MQADGCSTEEALLQVTILSSCHHIGKNLGAKEEEWPYHLHNSVGVASGCLANKKKGNRLKWVVEGDGFHVI